MPRTTEVEIWAVFDESGDYAVGTDLDSAAEAYRDTVSDAAAAIGIRHVQIKVTVPLPETIEITVVIPDTEPAPVVTVA